MKTQLIIPIIAAVLAGGYLVSKMVPKSIDGPFAVAEFGKLPCVADGREKPFDTLARNTLLKISDRQYFLDADEKKQPAIKWFLDVLSQRPEAFTHKVFRIDNLEVLDALALEERPGKFRYSFQEIGPKLAVIDEQGNRYRQMDESQITLYQKKVLELAEQLRAMVSISQWQHPLIVPPVKEGTEWASWFDAVRERAANWEKMPETRSDMYIRMAEDPSPVVSGMARMLIAYQVGEASIFNKEVVKYRQSLNMAMPKVMDKASVEVAFNTFDRFYPMMVLYVIAMVLVFFGFLRWPRTFNRSALAIAAIALIAHTIALVLRMYLSGRWGVFVTTLHTSAVFIAWGGVLFCLILEWFYRNGFGVLVATMTGFASLLIAHNMISDGSDSLKMMQAVLDTNFWLATHVTTITLGYSATFVAGIFSIVYIVKGVFTKSLTTKPQKELSSMIYGVICFALLLSFVGTVLGGIWADQSWGRFWGWDPKENGALMIVIWNALILHARWGGMVKARGIALLAIFGNIVTAWSWFGVNELGAGLHSYGFMDGTRYWLVLFAASQILMIGIGSIPLPFWRSFNEKSKPLPDATPSAGTPATS